MSTMTAVRSQHNHGTQSHSADIAGPTSPSGLGGGFTAFAKTGLGSPSFFGSPAAAWNAALPSVSAGPTSPSWFRNDGPSSSSRKPHHQSAQNFIVKQEQLDDGAATADGDQDAEEDEDIMSDEPRDGSSGGAGPQGGFDADDIGLEGGVQDRRSRSGVKLEQEDDGRNLRALSDPPIRQTPSWSIPNPSKDAEPNPFEHSFSSNPVSTKYGVEISRQPVLATAPRRARSISPQRSPGLTSTTMAAINTSANHPANSKAPIGFGFNTPGGDFSQFGWALNEAGRIGGALSPSISSLFDPSSVRTGLTPGPGGLGRDSLSAYAPHSPATQALFAMMTNQTPPLSNAGPLADHWMKDQNPPVPIATHLSRPPLNAGSANNSGVSNGSGHSGNDSRGNSSTGSVPPQALSNHSSSAENRGGSPLRQNALPPHQQLQSMQQQPMQTFQAMPRPLPPFAHHSTQLQPAPQLGARGLPTQQSQQALGRGPAPLQRPPSQETGDGPDDTILAAAALSVLSTPRPAYVGGPQSSMQQQRDQVAVLQQRQQQQPQVQLQMPPHMRTAPPLQLQQQPQQMQRPQQQQPVSQQQLPLAQMARPASMAAPSSSAVVPQAPLHQPPAVAGTKRKKGQAEAVAPASTLVSQPEAKKPKRTTRRSAAAAAGRAGSEVSQASIEPLVTHDSLVNMDEDDDDSRSVEGDIAGFGMDDDDGPKSGKGPRQQFETEEDKRKNFLERNRQAALKCRQRKKQWLQQLQQRVEYLSQDNDTLSATVTALRDEVANLRHILIAHKDCPLTGAPNSVPGGPPPDTTVGNYLQMLQSQPGPPHALGMPMHHPMHQQQQQR